ncbi:tyrosine-type recombinase/integrase [Tomitella fengzijianii]|uniref:Site-specific integrase n=1 Tax=Tomitella fengzijianii TaxID=2597660 RepID=A0A516X4F4_9ACTN|nr:site-specific integrase [Tomitella fengzijianii]QDQ97946.1 site-specific integrase [Tomitella fengzijianii]
MAQVVDQWTVRNPDGGRRLRGPRWGKGNRWLARWDEGGKRVSKSFANKDAALAHLEDVGSGTRAGTHITKERAALTIGDMWVLWSAMKSGTSKSTRAGYESAWRRIEPRWKDVPCGDVERADAVAWLNELTTTKGCKPGESKPLGGSSKRTTGIVLRALLDLAVDHKAVPANPMKRGDLPAAPETPRRYLSVGEVDGLLAAMPDEPCRLVVRTLVLTGLRPGECFGLQVQDLDARRGRIRVERAVDDKGTVGDVKTHQHREVPVGGGLLDDLTLAAGGRRRTAPLLRTSAGLSWTRNRWRPLWAKHGIDGLDTYELRHTAASWAIHAGANVKTVQTMLGHRTAAITLDIYSHLWDDELDAMPARLDAHMKSERERFRQRRQQSDSRGGNVQVTAV